MGTPIRVAVAMVFAAAAVVSAATTNVQLVEVLGSWQGDTAVQFVELALTADGASNVGGATLTFTNGSARRSLQLTKDVANGAAGSRILLATERAVEVLGVAPDVTLPLGYLPDRSGRVCYQVSDAPSDAVVVDCLAYGGLGGGNDGFGRSLRISPDNRSLIRVASTGANRADWHGALQPTPQNNIGEVVTLATLCGDGHIDAGEACDDANLDGATCKSQRFDSGDLACSQCHFDQSGCVGCGNGILEDDEDCDDDALGDRTCTSLGFTGGEIGCSHSCKVDTAECDPSYHVPGGGPTATDCLAEWRVTNGSHRPGRSGQASARQVCSDGDDECDADRTADTCTFMLAVCFDVDDARLAREGKACRPQPIARWSITRSSGDDAAGVVPAARGAVGAMTAARLDGEDVIFDPPLDGAGTCSAPFAAVVATGEALVLKARAVAVGGRRPDVDGLRLVCTE